MSATVEYGAMLDFDRRVLPGLLAIPCFRPPPDAEIEPACDAYASGEYARLIADWRAHASPTRARVSGLNALLYGSATWLPKAAIRASFLATVRMVLAASRRLFDEELAAPTARAIRTRLAFLDARHRHVPPGYTPEFRFPPGFALWIDSGTLDEAVARFQLAAVLNEVQQSAYSHHFAERFGIPEIHRHAEIEEQMALDYLAAFAPAVSRDLFRQAIQVLDGLNAAVFAVVTSNPIGVFGRCLLSPSGWSQFVAALARPLAAGATALPPA